MKPRRIGLFGGTFDPPHFGHVAALRAAASTGRFDLIEVTVAGDPYRKSLEWVVLGAPVRLAMAQVAFADLDLVEVSNREILRVGPSYTIDTVRELLNEAQSVDLIVGADLALQLDGWHQADALRDLVKVGVVPRPGSVTVEPPGWDSYQIPMDPVDLSSSFIRGLDYSSDSLKNFVPEQVIPLYEGARR
ncbi:MAG: nicotinate-nicotinamide nucleotide adenylyltransferase [Acidimicrobiaceae bacterium]|nr:nicotinate-nicotinamide nucleotide adenylyltransferase [Acidimicrobiaceae bacterium]